MSVGQSEGRKRDKRSLSQANTAEVVANGREENVSGISGAAFEIAAAKVTFVLHVSDDGLVNGGVARA
ncbi:hypothetical protein XF30_11210 [Bradyrhizobium sp. SUTN9-2]|nr:hypothetical protein XF30_11210 [Bradyrhizobium sp. SUTN9-2]